VASKTGIFNIALTRIGATKFLTNVDTQSGTLADACRTIYEEDRDFALRDFPWPFATSYADLALVGGSSSEAVNADWQYSYRYPSDCVFARRLVVANAGGRNNPEPPAFRIGRDSQGKLIYTNEIEAVLEYTARIDDVGEFDAMFVSMFAWKLAAALAPTQSRIKDMATTCMQMYEIDKTKAQSRALNEGQQETPIESEFMRARD
jgi:hypothetical protein